MASLTEDNTAIALIAQLIQLLGSSWIKEIVKKAWNLLRSLLLRSKYEGMYEVMDYETNLELCDPEGKEAVVKKKEKVRYLQNNVIAFQDQAWGDGKILLNYHCSPGTPVDRYRWGYKHHILISLGQVKSRGDIDEFQISWGIRRGFLSPTGFWGTEISHQTKRVAVRVIFPKHRVPKTALVLEKNRQKTVDLGKDSFKRLRGGNWEIFWEKYAPRLYEQYILKWEW